MSLRKQARKSNQRIYNLVYKGETIKIDQYKECLIIEESLQQHLKNYPSVYSFVNTLHKRLISAYKLKEVSVEKLYAKLYIGYKKSKRSQYFKEVGRFPTDDVAENFVKMNPKYIRAKTDLIKLEEDKMVLGSLVKALETKKELMQTLSANLRKEN